HLRLKYRLTDLASIVLDDGHLSSYLNIGLCRESQLQCNVKCGADSELYLTGYFRKSVSLCIDLIFADRKIRQSESPLTVGLDDVTLVRCNLDRSNCGSDNNCAARIEDAAGNTGIGECFLRSKQCRKDQEQRQSNKWK